MLVPFDVVPRFKNILCPTGLGSGAIFVFRYALSLAQQYQAKISLVHGLEPIRPPVRSMRSFFSEKAKEKPAEEQLQIQMELRARIERICLSELSEDPLGMRRIDQIYLEESPPFEAILNVSRAQKIDVIVMGTHRHTVLQGPTLGSTAMKVLHSSTIPVLLVRIPDGFDDRGF